MNVVRYDLTVVCSPNIRDYIHKEYNRLLLTSPLQRENSARTSYISVETQNADMTNYNILNEDEDAEEDALQGLPQISYRPQQAFNDGTNRRFRVGPQHAFNPFSTTTRFR